MAGQRSAKKIEAAPPSRLQADLARQILQLLKEQGAGSGYHLVEQDLCRQFSVSRTPIRGALKLLAAQGSVEPRANRGFVLVKAVKDVPGPAIAKPEDEEARQLFIDIADARNRNQLPDEIAQQELVRRFNTKLPLVVKVLRQMQELRLVERKPGNGWAFRESIHNARAQAESYAFRRLIEPAMLVQPTFKLDKDWSEKIRAAHLAFRRKRWRDTDAVEFYEMNADFHQSLARCSGNWYMFNAVQQQVELRRFLNYKWEYGVERVHESIDEHLEILDALEGGWNEKASALMLHHITSSQSLPSRWPKNDVDESRP